MKTKGMSKEETLRNIELLQKRIAFNNKLNAFVRKFRKENNVKRPYEQGQSVAGGFNGYWDEPTPEMRQAMSDILTKDSLEDLSWMPLEMKRMYARDISHIFGQVYSCAVNTYVLNDLHDCERHLQELEYADNKTEENDVIDLFNVVRDVDNTRLNLFFDGKPEEEVRTVLKRNGFKWSPYIGAWTRQLNANAENALTRVKDELSKMDIQ